MNFNKKLIKSASFLLFFTAISIILIIKYPVNIIFWSIFFFCLLFLLFVIKQIYHFRNLDANLPPENYSFLKVNFSTNAIVYPYGYFCRHSLAKAGEEIFSFRISQICLDTSLPSFILDNKEVLYVDYTLIDKLEAFAKLNNIKTANRIDIWKLLCEPYLKKYDEKQSKKTLEELMENGFGENEIDCIRKKIKWKVKLTHLFDFWEVGVDHFDYLDKRFFLTKKKYWWTMEIMLRSINKTN